MTVPKSPNNKSNIIVCDDVKSHRRKRVVESSSDSDGDDDDEVSLGSESESENSDDYRKLIAKLFPSKYVNQRVKEIKNSKKSAKKAIINEMTDKDSKAEKERKADKKKKNNKKKKNKAKRVIEEEEEEEDSDDEEEEEEEDDRILRKVKEAKKQFNIYFTIGDGQHDSEDEDYEDDDDDEYEDDDSDEEDSDEEEGDYEEDEDEDEYDSDEEEDTHRKSKRNKSKTPSAGSTMGEEELNKSFKLLKDQLSRLSTDNPKNSVYKQCLEDLDVREGEEKKKMKKTQKKERVKNTKSFRKLIKNRSATNDFSYFKDNMSIEEQGRVLKEVEEINKISRTEKPYRLALLESDIPTQLKSVAMSKISALRYMEPGQGEYYKVQNWVDTFMQIPFNSYKSLPIQFDAGVEKCHDFMEGAKNTLDEAVYGMNDAKMQIMQLVGQWITNPKAIGTAVAIKGPMGTGKTTLIKDGISKILGRDFAFIALGGATDSSFLEGHSYTYEGSTWGKIVDILIKSKSMNPVIYFDELDKISDTPKGDEIAGILTHLTDTTQNSMFHDKYFSEVDFDLSKCMFIFSYNDESKVNPILLDRMYKIQTEGYEKKDKLVIANKYLLPKIMEQVNFNEGDITFTDETITYIIENFTADESGVRNLKRCLEVICTKLNLYRLMKPGSKLFEKETALDVSFPYTVKVDVVRKLIKNTESDARAAMFNTLYV